MDLKAKDASGHVPLTAAAAEGDAAGVEKLLAAGADVNLRGQSGKTALAHAATAGHLDAVQLLIARRARLDSKSGGATPLLDAAGGGHLECVRALVDAGAKLDIRTKAGHTAVCRAYAGHHPRVVLYLLEAGAPMGMAFSGTLEQLVKWAEKEIKAGRE